MAAAGETEAAEPEAAGRWRSLAVLAACLILGMAPWFSSSAVAPALRGEWSTGALGLPALAVAVQLGFATGAILLALAGVPDVVPRAVPHGRRQQDAPRRPGRLPAIYR